MFKNKSKMKKRYIIPEIEIEQINMDLTILTGSANPQFDPNQNTDGMEAPDLIDFGDDDVDW